MSNIYKYNSMSGILVFNYVAPEGKLFFSEKESQFEDNDGVRF